MSESCCGREACSCCGSDSWTEAHFRHGQGIICEPCWRTIAHTRTNNPPAQQALPLAQTTQQQPACKSEPEPERWGDHVQADFGVLDGGTDV